jgi:NAD(P)-dependent dehydrogenase (short-subunit alcohol dehydrogenase family)
MLAGKVVAVTGGGRGIGRAVALLAAREGANVIVNDPGVAADGAGADAAPASAVAAEIAAGGGKACANFASVADPAGAQSIVDDALCRFGRIDAVVNCAGILRDRIWHKLSLEDWRAVIDVHLNGSFLVSQAATPHFREQGSGSFIHFTSGAGLVGNVGQANYAAAKMGIVGLSQSIALDMARYGVRSNCIAPIAWTRMMAGIPASEGSGAEAREERLGDLQPDHVAPLVAYLASDRSEGITNQVFGVRGGEIAVFSKPRPMLTAFRADGWSADAIAEELMPGWRAQLPPPLETAVDLFSRPPGVQV